MDARGLLASLEGTELTTVGGAWNRVLAIQGDDVIVATAKSPAGRPVPIRGVQSALDLLEVRGEIVIDVDTVGYRSAFIGAVLREARLDVSDVSTLGPWADSGSLRCCR